MPSSGSDGPLHDMRRHIELARTFTGSMTFTEFKADRRTVLAVIRCLEIISEASRRVSMQLKARHPEIAWADIAVQAMSTGMTTKLSKTKWSEIRYRVASESFSPLSMKSFRHKATTV